MTSPISIEFTFYCSSIKGAICKFTVFSFNPVFTFYCSSIKGVFGRMETSIRIEFTFYCSSIKGFGRILQY